MIQRRLLSALIAALAVSNASAETWKYRGTLNDGGKPANGQYDLRLTLIEASGTKAITQPLTLFNVRVQDGNFATDVDFGIDLSNAPAMNLKTEVASGGSGFASMGEPTRFDPKAALAGICWDTTGNVVVPGEFLGSSNDAAVDIRSNNVRTASFQSATDIDYGNGVRVALGSPGNVASAFGASVGGGGASEFDDGSCPQCTNAATARFATVSGGIGNQSTGENSTIGGGDTNFATGFGSSVVGGSVNRAAGGFATAGGGQSNCAGGATSWAGGRSAVVRSGNVGPGNVCAPISSDSDGDEGTFVWSDSQSFLAFSSTGPNQFLVRADGGVMFNTTTSVSANDDLIIGAKGLSGDADADLVLRTRAGKRFTAYLRETDGAIVLNPGSATVDTKFLLGGAQPVALRYLNTPSGAYLSTAGLWTDNSSRALKTDFVVTDASAMLDKVLALPVNEWSYRVSPEIRHVGPVAEDFHASFGIGESPAHIASVDSVGVALAAIQGLNAKLESENARLRSDIDALKAAVAELKALR